MPALRQNRELLPETVGVAAEQPLRLGRRNGQDLGGGERGAASNSSFADVKLLYQVQK
jgi:hypothetical protein